MISDRYLEKSRIEFIAATANMNLLLLNLINDDSTTWIAFRNCVSELSDKQRNYLNLMLK